MVFLILKFFTKQLKYNKYGIYKYIAKADVTYANGKYNSDQSGMSFEVSTGINSQINNDFSMFYDIAYEKGSIIESVSGNLGLRYTW